jgi:xanthine dehydrogenase YagS FAD-binding subunit
MKPFAYERASDVHDALVAARSNHVRFLGGGTNLVDLMKAGVEAPDRLVDVRFLPMAGVTETPDGSVRIGATTTNSAAAADPMVRRRYPALSQAIVSGASGQLRNMATVGGNLLQRTRCAYFADLSQSCNKRQPGSGCPAIPGEHHNHAILGWSDSCVATNPSDMAVPLAAFDATVHYESLDGAGEIAFDDFFLPVGDTPQLETSLPPGALISAVTIPAASASPRSHYRKVRERASYAFATVSIAAALDVDDGVIRSARVALGGVASRPWRARLAEAVLHDGPATRSAFRAAADEELSAATPLRDNAYKITLARNLIEVVLAELAGVDE